MRQDYGQNVLCCVLRRNVERRERERETRKRERETEERMTRPL
jgi:hypothetical protein